MPEDEIRKDGSIRTEGFQKMVLGMRYLMEDIHKMMMHYKSFRVEIDFNAEAPKTTYKLIPTSPEENLVKKFKAEKTDDGSIEFIPIDDESDRHQGF